jgi:hypothetical protein
MPPFGALNLNGSLLPLKSRTDARGVASRVKVVVAGEAQGYPWSHWPSFSWDSKRVHPAFTNESALLLMCRRRRGCVFIRNSR